MNVPTSPPITVLKLTTRLVKIQMGPMIVIVSLDSTRVKMDVKVQYKHYFILVLDHSLIIIIIINAPLQVITSVSV